MLDIDIAQAASYRLELYHFLQELPCKFPKLNDILSNTEHHSL